MRERERAWRGTMSAECSNAQDKRERLAGVGESQALHPRSDMMTA